MRLLDRKQMAWRAAQDIADGMVVNLGIGIPVLAADYLPEGREVVFQSENGVIGVGAVRRRQRANTDHAILRLNEDINLRPQIVGHEQRHAQAQVDEHAVGDVLGGAPRDLQTVERLRAHCVTVTTRST